VGERPKEQIFEAALAVLRAAWRARRCGVRTHRLPLATCTDPISSAQRSGKIIFREDRGADLWKLIFSARDAQSMQS
jgi:hypothetical protein